MKKINLQSGQAMMIATILFLMLSIIIVFGLAGPITRQQKITSGLLSSRQSYFLAEAGIEDAVYRIKNNQAVSSTEILSLSGSSATTVTIDTADGKEVTATGSVKEAVRKVRANLVVGEPVSFSYGAQIGTGGLSFSNNAGVIGNVHSNASISGSNGSFITGDAFAVGAISGVEVSGQTQPGVSSSTFPISDSQIVEWKNAAETGGTVGSQTFSDEGNVLGLKKVQGNLTLSSGAQLTVTGVLWITGNLVVGNNAAIRLSSSFGSNDGLIVVDGNITVSNGASLSGSGTSGSYIMILTTSSSGSAVTLSNNSGAVILYAHNGGIQLNNNVSLRQVTAKTLSLSNNVTVTYESGILNAIFTTTPAAAYDIKAWKEVE